MITMIKRERDSSVPDSEDLLESNLLESSLSLNEQQDKVEKPLQQLLAPLTNLINPLYRHMDAYPNVSEWNIPFTPHLRSVVKIDHSFVRAFVSNSVESAMFVKLDICLGFMECLLEKTSRVVEENVLLEYHWNRLRDQLTIGSMPLAVSGLAVLKQPCDRSVRQVQFLDRKLNEQIESLHSLRIEFQNSVQRNISLLEELCDEAPLPEGIMKIVAKKRKVMQEEQRIVVALDSILENMDSKS